MAAAGPPVTGPRILVVIPNWVGDVVMATPVLAALRSHFATARITYLLRPYVLDVVAGGGWHDDVLLWPAGRGQRRERGLPALVWRLRSVRFDLALLLTNSFRAALVAWLGGARRRVGYARDGRGPLLTDRLLPRRESGAFRPVPALDSYVALAEHVGAPVRDRTLRLGVTPEQEAAGRELLERHGLRQRAYALLNPGAAFGAAKCWPPERFAALCDALRAQVGLWPVLCGGPDELPLLRRIAAQARGPVAVCERPGTTLGSLKVLVRHARLMVCNDTGPRHYALAFGVPTVTLFGPTHQAWTDTRCGHELKLQVPVACGPCQLRTCPLDHRCLTALAVDHALHAVRTVLARPRPAVTVSGPTLATDAGATRPET